ncbi:MAG: hypothetical protein Q8K82_01000 [Gemmatimonadaceae bacterium]|nr:hypothetical protein [Gemmatimonadaceae bacterium]
MLDDLIDRYDRMTVRQVYYALEVQGIVEKTEGGYRQVQQQVLTMRREGLLDWDFITDGTRWQRKPESWESAGDYFESMVRHYRRDLWRGQGVRIEVWLEKDALADVVVDITAAWDVALMVSRGQSSSTFLYTAAKAAQAAYLSDGTETIIYALYDYDAGGQRASHTIEREIPKYAPGVPITFERLAVTQEQISAWNLPTRPAKKSDPQAAQFGAVAVELDAIPPDRLRALVEDSIITHVDTGAWAIEQAIEAEESAGLLALCDTFNAGLEDDR